LLARFGPTSPSSGSVSTSRDLIYSHFRLNRRHPHGWTDKSLIDLAKHRRSQAMKSEKPGIQPKDEKARPTGGQQGFIPPWKDTPKDKGGEPQDHSRGKGEKK
jgi:hypothetical protein